jgi:gliding motility-associated-like protein
VDSVTNVLCNGSSTGGATVSVSGGISPYTYLWVNTDTTIVGRSNIVSGLSAGTYIVGVSDSNGCYAVDTIIITQPTALADTISSLTNVTCHADSNGSATITVSGGVSPYTYSWSQGGNTTNSATGLKAGTYTVTVTDSNSCTLTVGVTITQPAALALSLTIVDAACNSSNGTATVSVTGGVSPYTYLWVNPSVPDTIGYTNMVTGLSAGTYLVGVADSNGCYAIDTAVIVNLPPPSISITSTNVLCLNDSNGTATATITGGVSPFTYLWTPDSATGSTATGLSAGTYTLTIHDSNGCVAIDSVTISQPKSSVSAVTTVITSVSCNGGSNGSASVTASGGTSPYIYSWSNGQTTDTATGLSATTYTVTVTDSNGCATMDSITISQPTALIADTAIITSISCNGGSNGSASVIASGGTSPYGYSWSNGQTTDTATGLSATTYTITVTDSNGCSTTNSITITQPVVLTASIADSSNVMCFGGSSGSATVLATGGTSPYTYKWAPGGGSSTVEIGFTAGIYTVTVTDNNGCTATATVHIGQPSQLDVTITNNSPSCGPTSGTASATVTGGTSGYSYLWTPDLQTTASITGLSSGTYTVTVTDANGCTATASTDITASDLITGKITNTGITCNGLKNGTATVLASGGTAPYTYKWTPSGGTGATASNLSAGTYTLTITDINGCTFTETVDITEPTALKATMNSSNISCNGGANGKAWVTVSGGTTPYNYQWTPSGGFNDTAIDLTAGAYTVTVTDANGCTTTAAVNITQPSPLAVTPTITNALCNYNSNGSINLTVSGATPPYTYLWSNAASSTTPNVSGLSVGTYSVVITDSAGCINTASYKVSFDSLVIANASNATICYNSSVMLNGDSSVNAQAYQWFVLPVGPGSMPISDSVIASISNLDTTTSYILIAHNGTCVDTTTVTVTVYPQIIVDAGTYTTVIAGTQVTLGGMPTGPSGSAYLWQPGLYLSDSTASNPIATPTATTTYTVLVTNQVGCPATDTVTVDILAPIQIPSGFTPNADGVNDYWILGFSDLFPNMDVEVFNRWGQRVFNSIGYAKPWDGTYDGDGKELPVGTYYYIINLNDSRYPKAYTGPVTILR